MITDMTAGSPGRVLWRFTLPMLGSIVFQQLYNIADSVIAGRFIGEDALAAVGASYPITMLFMAVAVGTSVGCSVVISQLFGARQLRELKLAVNTAFLASLGIGAVLTAGGLLAGVPLLRLLQTPDNIFDDSFTYLRIYILGFLFLFLYNISTGIFTALGDSRTPFYFLLGSSAANVALDLLFVAVFDMGVAGVAWATFLAQGAAALLAAATLRRRLRGMTTEGRTGWFSREMLARILRLAVPSILQQSFVSVGNLFIQGLVNSFGSSVGAGYSAAVKLNTFAVTSFSTMSNALSSYTAQNIGAGAVDRVPKGYRAGLLLALCVAVPFMAAYLGFGGSMVGLFLPEESGAALGTGLEFLRIVAPFYPFVMLKLLTDGVLRGAGAVRCFTASTFTDLILRVVLAYVLTPALGPAGIWLSWPVGWVLSTALAFGFYRFGAWKRSALA